jgi:hypothetical protein
MDVPARLPGAVSAAAFRQTRDCFGCHAAPKVNIQER